MRKLCLMDAIDVVKICKKANLRDEIENLLMQGRLKDADQERIGVRALMSIVFACAENGIDNDLYALLGRIAERSADDIATMPIESLWSDVLMEIAKNNDLSSFFGSAVKSMT